MVGRQVVKKHPKLERLIARGDLASYEYENEDGGIAPDNERLKLTFRSGATLEIRSGCGSAADASSYFEIEGQPTMETQPPSMAPTDIPPAVCAACGSTERLSHFDEDDETTPITCERCKQLNWLLGAVGAEKRGYALLSSAMGAQPCSIMDVVELYSLSAEDIELIHKMEPGRERAEPFMANGERVHIWRIK